MMASIFSIIFTVIVSGLMLYTSSKKAVENMTRSISNSITLMPIDMIDSTEGIHINYNIDPEDMESFINSRCVDKYNYYAISSVNFNNIEKYIGDKEKYNKMMEKMKNHTYFYDGTLYSLVESAYDVAFTVNGYQLIEGRPITSKDSGNKVCLISNELANLNHIKLGDIIDVTDVYKPIDYSLTVIGIFSIPIGEYWIGIGSSPAEIIFMPVGTMNNYFNEKNYKNAKIYNACVYLKNLSDQDKFIYEVKSKLNIRNLRESHFDNNIGQIPKEFEGKTIDEVAEYYSENHWYDLQIDREWFDMVAAPIENVSRTAGIIVVGIVGGTTIILVLLAVLSLKGRNKEFGVLLSMGESRLKVIAQVLLEESIIIFISAFIGLVFGITIGSTVLKGFSNDVYEQKAKEILEVNNRLIDSYKEELINFDDHGWNHNGASDLIGKGSSRITLQANVSPKIDLLTIILYMVTTFGIIIFVLLTQMITILRLKPARILSSKS